MQKNKWDKRFIELAKMVSEWSKDPRTKVGAVVVDDKNRVLGIGYNGFPRGVIDDERLDDKPLKLQMIVHAEANAILNSHGNLEGATLYCWPGTPPCNECCKTVIQSGIRRVVGPKLTGEESSWYKSCEVSKIMCKEAGVVIDVA
jgi:dCMP deaminase